MKMKYPNETSWQFCEEITHEPTRRYAKCLRGHLLGYIPVRPAWPRHYPQDSAAMLDRTLEKLVKGEKP